MDTSKLDVQEDGTIKGLSEAIEALKKSDAYLFEQAPAAPGGFNPPPATPTKEEPKSF